MILCALATPARLTVIVVVPLPLMSLTDPIPDVTDAPGKWAAEAKVRYDSVIITHSPAAAFDTRISCKRKVNIKRSRAAMHLSRNHLQGSVWL